jgi:hypothetical protein
VDDYAGEPFTYVGAMSTSTLNGGLPAGRYLVVAMAGVDGADVAGEMFVLGNATVVRSTMAPATYVREHEWPALVNAAYSHEGRDAIAIVGGHVPFTAEHKLFAWFTMIDLADAGCAFGLAPICMPDPGAHVSTPTSRDRVAYLSDEAETCKPFPQCLAAAALYPENSFTTAWTELEGGAPGTYGFDIDHWLCAYAFPGVAGFTPYASAIIADLDI